MFKKICNYNRAVGPNNRIAIFPGENMRNIFNQLEMGLIGEHDKLEQKKKIIVDNKEFHEFAKVCLL